jgi:hypothetical protein
MTSPSFFLGKVSEQEEEEEEEGEWEEAEERDGRSHWQENVQIKAKWTSVSK